MSEITKETVEKIARLSNIRLENEEVSIYAGQLEQVLGYMNKLNELNTDDIPQTVHAMPIKNIWRDDQVESSLDRNKVLAGAPEAEDGCFKVPRIIE